MQFLKSAVCLLLLLSPQRLKAESPSPPPGSPARASHSPVPGLHLSWEVWFPRFSTETDSIWIRSEITSSEKALVVDFGTDVAIPALKITRLGDPERLIYEGTPPSDRVAELRRRTGLIKPGLGLVDTGSALVNTTIFHEFRMDLRQLVKEFPIGVYRAQFSFPDIRLTRKDGPVTDEAFVSPEFEFEVGTCGPTLEDLPRRYDWFSPIPDLVRATPNSSDRTFTITNRAEYPVHLKYRPEVNTADGTYAGMIFLQKWTCEGEWEGAGLLGFARSNKPLPFITLQPGESAKLVAPDWLVDGYGYYRYGMEVYRGDVSNPTRESSLLHLSLLSPHFQVRFPNEKSSELAGEADQ